jgi:hypothetical protein
VVVVDVTRSSAVNDVLAEEAVRIKISREDVSKIAFAPSVTTHVVES